jgi:hypothetical protein
VIPPSVREVAVAFREWLVRTSNSATIRIGPAEVVFYPQQPRPDPPPPSELALRARGERPASG